MIGLMITVAVIAGLTHYDCVMDVPSAIDLNGEATTAHKIDFPQLSADAWHFSLALDKGRGGKGIDATITWPKDPIQLAGKHAALVTADGSIAFSAFEAGPCMFTENMCMSLVNMARQPDNSVKFIVLPAALATDHEADTRKPFVVVAEGSCKEVIR